MKTTRGTMDPRAFRVLRRIERAGDELSAEGNREAAHVAWRIYGGLTAACYGPGANLCGDLYTPDMREASDAA